MQGAARGADHGARRLAVLAYNVVAACRASTLHRVGILPAGAALDGQLDRRLRRRFARRVQRAHAGPSTHLQFLHAEFFAVMLFALDRLIARDGWTTHVWLARQASRCRALTSYLPDGLLGRGCCCLPCLSRAGEWWRGGASTLGRASAAARWPRRPVVAVPRGYVVVQLQIRWASRAASTKQIAAIVVNYLATGARVHYDCLEPADRRAASTVVRRFPGSWRWRWSSSRQRSAEHRRIRAFGCAPSSAPGCAAVSLAPLLPFYPRAARVHSAVPGGSRARASRPGRAPDGCGARRFRRRRRCGRRMAAVARSWPLVAALLLLVQWRGVAGADRLHVVRRRAGRL